MVLDGQGQIVRALELAAQSVEDARAAGDTQALLIALYGFAWVSVREARIDDANRALIEAEAIAGAHAFYRIKLIGLRGALSYARSDYEAAVAAFAESVREHRARGNTSEALRAAMNLAHTSHVRGETMRAIAIGREILPVAREDPDVSLRALVLCNLAGCLVAVDDLLGAAQVAGEVIELLGVDQPTHYCVSLAVEYLALTYASIGDLQRAGLLAGYSDAALHAVGYARDVGEQRGRDRLVTALRAGLPEHELEQITGDGQRLGPAAAFAISLELMDGLLAEED